MKAYGEEDVQIHVFSISELFGSELHSLAALPPDLIG
jgi:hypothetical protein